MRKKDVPEHIKHSAVVMEVLASKLGFGNDKLPDLLERADRFSKAAVAGDTVAALEDDLDAWSVAVGFAAAFGMYAVCAGAADTKKQRGKAEDN